MKLIKGFFQIVLGFILGVLFAALIESVRAVNNPLTAGDYSSPEAIGAAFENVVQYMQKKNLVSLAKSTPTLNDLGQGDVFFSTSAAKGWTRIQNDLYYFNMTKF